MHSLNNNPLIKTYVEGNSFGRTLSMDFEILEPGKVRYYFEVKEEHLATHRAAHGGMLAALADGALGVAALSLVVENEEIVATVDLQLKYVRPVLLGDLVEAWAEVVHQGKRLIFSEVKIRNGKGDLLAYGSGTFNAYPKEKAGY
ncbi:MAG: PaaI family thioesterase [Bacteroidetes bacterium]|nr:MAG: PaaI family thioesterase [Bacteroidota bacterium]